MPMKFGCENMRLLSRDSRGRGIGGYRRGRGIGGYRRGRGIGGIGEEGV